MTQMKLVRLSEKLCTILIERLDTLETLVGDTQKKKYVNALTNTITSNIMVTNKIALISVSAQIHAILIEHLIELENLIADPQEKIMIDALKNTILRNSLDGILENET